MFVEYSALLILYIRRKEWYEDMKRISGYKRGYHIKIADGFYEVISGNRVVFFGECRKNSTIQEIANKTILLNMEGNNDRQRVKSKIRTGREKRNRARNQVDAVENAVSF